MKRNSRPSSRNSTLVIEALSPAKINWFLKVLGKRSDGYHNLFTLMQKVNLTDKLVFHEAEDIEVINSLGVPQEKDIACRAALVLRDSKGVPKGARIEIEKTIPSEAGLGGGSSNGATVLRTLNKLWGLDLTEPELMALGASLGSDVPFFVQESPLAAVEARGEVVRPIAVSSCGIFLLIVKPPFGVSTAMAYRMLERHSSKAYCDDLLERAIRSLEKGDLGALATCLENDLEESAFRIAPELRTLKDEVLASGALGALVSGSGSSVFGVFETKRQAQNAARRFKDCQVFVVDTL